VKVQPGGGLIGLGTSPSRDASSANRPDRRGGDALPLSLPVTMS
jgi:hypothetical protein